MKQIVIILAVFAIAINTFSGSTNEATDNNDKYCAKMKDGMLRVMHEGTVITSDVTLQNGTVIKTDGMVITKDGVKMALNEGECIGYDGVLPKKEGEKPQPK